MASNRICQSLHCQEGADYVKAIFILFLEHPEFFCIARHGKQLSKLHLPPESSQKIIFYADGITHYKALLIQA